MWCCDANRIEDISTRGSAAAPLYCCCESAADAESDAAVVAARATAPGVAEAAGAWVEAEASAAGEAAPQVRVTLREVYWELAGVGREGGAAAAGAADTAGEEGGDRRSCSFRIDFTRVGAEVTRGEAALWQSRIREAVHLWQAEESGQFKLR